MAVVTLPDFTPRTKNYVSLYASLVPIVVGTALIWHNSLIVTVNDNAARAANYYLLAFYYIWVCSWIILKLRSKGLRAMSGAFYLLQGGLLFEIIANNSIASYGNANRFRIYVADITLLDSTPSEAQRGAVKQVLAGIILAHFGAFVSIFAGANTKNQQFSLKGNYLCMYNWLIAVPGLICLFTSKASAPDSRSFVGQEIYQSCWSIIDTCLGIIILQTMGMLFDIYEMVACSVVIIGTRGLFILGSMFSLLFMEDKVIGLKGDTMQVTAGGILCWIASVYGLFVAMIYMRSRAAMHYKTIGGGKNAPGHFGHSD